MDKDSFPIWLPLAPTLRSRSLADVTRNVEQIHDMLSGPKAPSMQMIWDNLTHYLKGPTTAALINAGHDVAARIDKGIGAGEGNGYHHATHFKEVTFNQAVLTRIASWQGNPLMALEQVVQLFCGMCHDYGHDGGKNGPTPLRLENQSLQGIRSDLKRHGVDKRTTEMIELIISSTDVSRSPDYVNTLKAGRQMAAPEGYEFLAKLALPEHKRTAELAAMMRDADVLLAAGITGATAKDSKAQLGREWGAELGYKDHLGFLKFILSQPDGQGGRQTGFASEAGKFFNPNIPKVTHSLAQLLRPAARPALN